MQRRHTTAVQYTIRRVPAGLDRILREKARRSKRSINEVALEALSAGAGMGSQVPVHHDLDFVFDSWVIDKRVEEALAAQRNIDVGMWK